MAEAITTQTDVKILLADDHSVVRQGLKQILINDFGNVEFGEACNAVEVFKMLKEKKWSILILDINMPGRDGLEVLKQIKEEKINIPVLILSMHPEEHMALRALKLGASGYLTKESAGDELITAVNKILSGRKYITNTIAEQLASHHENPSNKLPHELLSDREFQTTLLMAKGNTISQIAQMLSLSVPTVSTYRARILEKMNLQNTAQITHYALIHHLV